MFLNKSDIIFHKYWTISISTVSMVMHNSIVQPIKMVNNVISNSSENRVINLSKWINLWKFHKSRPYSCIRNCFTIPYERRKWTNGRRISNSNLLCFADLLVDFKSAFINSQADAVKMYDPNANDRKLAK